MNIEKICIFTLSRRSSGEIWVLKAEGFINNFQTERVVYSGGYGHDFHAVGEVGLIEDLAIKFGKHLGRDSYYDIEPNEK